MDCLITQFRNLYLNCDCGMGYVIRCPDGRFVLVDGGLGEAEESDAFLETVKSMSDDEKPAIAMWIITHAHSDHFGVFTKLSEKNRYEFNIEKVVFRFPDPNKARGWSNTTDFYRAVKDIGKDKIIVPKTGDSFDIGGCVIDFLFTEADLPEGAQYPINDTSLAFRISYNGKRALFIGDGAEIQSSILCAKYSEKELKSDVFQVGHHGYWGGSPELHKKVSPSVVLWPTPDFRFPLLLPHPESERDEFIAPDASSNALFKMWSINGSLLSLPSVRVISVSGREQITVNMSRFSSLSDPWGEQPYDFLSIRNDVPVNGVIIGDNRSNLRVYDLHWSFINGGFYSFGPAEVDFDEKGAVLRTVSEKLAACQLVQSEFFKNAESFRVIIKGVLFSGEMSVQYSGDTPVRIETLSGISVRPEYGKHFELEINADAEKKTSEVVLNGVSRTFSYNPDKMKGLYLFLKNAELSVKYLAVL